jgi:hypothetical protein
MATMTDVMINRVVIACDPVGDNRSSIEAAARLAACWNAALHAVFVQDEGLLRLAGLPFSRHIGLGGGISENFDVDAILHQFAANAERVRSMLEAAAREYDIGWSFDIVRGDRTVSTLSLADRDLLVIEDASRPFRDFRLASRWLAAAFETDRPIFLIRNADHKNDSVVAVVQRTGPSAERIIATATDLALANDCRLTVLLAETAPSRDTILEQLGELSKKISMHCRIEPVALLHAALQCRAGKGTLLVIDADPAVNQPAFLKDVAAATEADMLFVR